MWPSLQRPLLPPGPRLVPSVNSEVVHQEAGGRREGRMGPSTSLVEHAAEEIRRRKAKSRV